MNAEKHSPASSVQITDYIKPELLAVALVLYFVGIGLKHSQTIPCEKKEEKRGMIRHEGKRKDYVKRCIFAKKNVLKLSGNA